MKKVKHRHITPKVKQSLFDLTYAIGKKTRQDIMSLLSQQLQMLLDATSVTIYLYHRWQKDRRLFVYGSSEPIVTIKELTYESFPTYISNKAKIATISNPEIEAADGEQAKSNYILQLECNNTYKSVILLRFEEEITMQENALEEIRELNEQFLDILYNQRQSKFIQDRNHLLLRLSTKLHSTNHTIEVLDRAYRTACTLYPSFEYCFLMSQEFQCDHLPVRLIEYHQNPEYSPGLNAFINNTIEIVPKGDVKDGIINQEQVDIYAPLPGKQGVYGVLQITIPARIEVEDDDIEFIDQFTNIVGRAIERTTLYQSSTQLITDLQIITNASQELNLNLDRKDITKTVVDHIISACDAEEVGVVLFPEILVNNGTNTSYEVQDGSTSYFQITKSKQLIENIIEDQKENPQACFTSNMELEKGFTSDFRSLMVIPLWASNAMFGFIVVGHPLPNYFSFDKFKFIQSLAQHAALAYANSLLKEELRKSAITDYLTKLYSRSYLDERVLQEIEAGNVGGFILFDIDDFKSVNDTYGHYVGDKVLIQIADVIRETMKNDGIYARWGGEEFAIYLPNHSASETLKKANLLRENVKLGTEPQVTISVGMSTWENKVHDSIEQLFIRTDEALYEAKTTGKDKVVQSEYSKSHS